MFSTELAEIVLIVEDVERSARFYREVVGLTPENKPENGWAWFWAGEPGHAQRLALHKGPLLFEGQEIYGPVYFDWMEALSYYFYDPDGNLLEFWSPDPRPMASRKGEIFES